MPASSTAPVMTSRRSWTSVLSVCRTIGEMLQPTMAIWSGFATSVDPVHEFGVEHIVLAIRAPGHYGPFGIGDPPGRDPQPDMDVVVGAVDQRLVGEHHIDAVEEDEDPGEGLGLGLARVLDV